MSPCSSCWSAARILENPDRRSSFGSMTFGRDRLPQPVINRGADRERKRPTTAAGAWEYRLGTLQVAIQLTFLTSGDTIVMWLTVGTAAAQ